MIQTLILKTASPTDHMVWNVLELKQILTDEERRAWATGENLGTKVDLSSGSNALIVDGWNCQWRRKDSNDPHWLAHQTCWHCGKVGHICQGCMAMQMERDAY